MSRKWVQRGARVLLRLAVATGLAWGALAGVEHAYDYATTSPRFETRALVFSATAHVDDARLRELMAIKPATNILSLDLDDLASRIVADPWVARASVVRELPDTLIVQVDEHRPAAVLLISGDLFLVDSEGEPFKRLERGERDQLPVITGVSQRLLLERPAEFRSRIRRGLEVLELYASKRRPRLSEINVEEAGKVTLYTAARGSRLDLGRGDVAAKLARYDALRAALADDAEELAVLHLDASAAPGRPERVVAKFFAGEKPALLADATQPATPAAEQEHNEPERSDWRTSGRRIPRYE